MYGVLEGKPTIVGRTPAVHEREGTIHDMREVHLAIVEPHSL